MSWRKCVTYVMAPHPVNVKSVQLVLEQRARARGRPVPLPVKLPRAELGLTVKPPNLGGYDNLADDGCERNEVDDV